MHTPLRVRRSLLLPAFLAAILACDQTSSQESSTSIQRPFPSEPPQFYHDPSNAFGDSSQLRYPKYIFFPPVPPPLEFPSRPGVSTPTSITAPPELGAYVSEFFYPELASLLKQNTLSASRREALRKYHDEKRALQQELRAALTRAESLEPAARTALLTELAGAQDPKIARLEARAEELRHDLYDKDFDWSAFREWHLGESANLPDAASEVAQVMQAAAFFQDGLSVQQRGLLREFATEIIAGLPPQPTYTDIDRLVADRPAAEKAAAHRAYFDTMATAPQPINPPAKPGSIYFSPSLTRLRLPDGLSDSARATLKDYTRRKIALRQQFLDIIRKEDIPKSGRSQRFAALAAAQTAGFAELETLAEEVRRQLPPSSPPAAPSPLVALPAALTQRLIAFSDRLEAVQQETRLKVAAIRTRYQFVSFTAEVTPETLRSTFRESKLASGGDVKKAKAELAALTQHYEQTVGAQGNLGKERAALHADIVAALPPDDSAQADVAISEAAQLSLVQRVTPALAAYHTAALAPGLSPAQRRLLFDGAVEDLGPALPNSRRQPTRRPPPLPL